MNHKVDLLVVTVNNHETKAVLDAFRKETGQASKGVMKGQRAYRDLGTVNGARVFQMVSEMGSMLPGASHEAVRDAIDSLAPSAIVAVGVAFGVLEKQNIGDLIISKQLFLYESQRVNDNGTITFRGSKVDSSVWLLSYFRTFSQAVWQGANVKPGLVLSGEKLIDNEAFCKALVEQEPEAVGGEMEGSGLYVASKGKKDWIIIKGICDFADGNKSKDKDANQMLAAANAADFLIQALNDTPLIEVLPDKDQDTSPVVSVNTTKGPLPLKRSQPGLVALEKSQPVEFHGGPLCNQIAKVNTVLPDLVAVPDERGMWANYKRVKHLDKDGKIAYSHMGTGSSGGNPQNFAVPLILTTDGQKLIDIKFDPARIRDQVIGLATSLEGRFKIEKWTKLNKEVVELIGSVIERYDLSAHELSSAISELGLLDSEKLIDGIVLEPIRDTAIRDVIEKQLKEAGLKLFICDGG